MNALPNSLINVWNDLRARRLLPVAVLLLVGLVAAPVVLSKQADESAPAPEQPAPAGRSSQPQGPAELAQVKLDDEVGKGSGSSLSAFEASNPFAPPRGSAAAGGDEAPGGELGTPAPETGGTPDAGTGTGTEGGTAPEGGSPDDGTGGGETQEFTYVLDVTFWANGRKRSIEGMQKLDMLPNEAAPLLIFMGVSEGAGNAVFLVDSTLATAGEGKCKPSRSECAFLYLGAGSEQEFTNDEGDSYRLRIEEIRKVKVGGKSGTSASSGKSSKSARAAVGVPTPTRRFAFPVLTDLVVESVGGSDDSTDASGRR